MQKYFLNKTLNNRPKPVDFVGFENSKSVVLLVGFLSFSAEGALLQKELEQMGKKVDVYYWIDRIPRKRDREKLPEKLLHIKSLNWLGKPKEGPGKELLAANADLFFSLIPEVRKVSRFFEQAVTASFKIGIRNEDCFALTVPLKSGDFVRWKSTVFHFLKSIS